jgi:hypothetical protein
VMVWALGWLYLRKADRVFDPLAKKAADEALRAGAQPGSGRFERESASSDEARAGGTGSTTTAMASGQDGAPADREVSDR